MRPCVMGAKKYTVWYRTIRRDLVRCRVSRWKRCVAATGVSLQEAENMANWITRSDGDCETCVVAEEINLDA